MKTLLTPAIMTGYNPHPDNSMTFRFRSQELNEEQKIDAITHYQAFGWLGFVDSEDATDLEIPSESPAREGKSQSERLRSTLYILFSKKYPGAKPSAFEAWRTDYMENILDQVKEKIHAYEV